MDREATTMSVREMRELLGIKKTDSYWLLKKNCFEIVKISREDADCEKEL